MTKDELKIIQRALREAFVKGGEGAVKLFIVSKLANKDLQSTYFINEFKRGVYDKLLEWPEVPKELYSEEPSIGPFTYDDVHSVKDVVDQ